ncbi:transmembrane protein 87B-like isoform X1 [Neltuma alba]|uniref:transmembrane protein 87B isoform X1 n=2 Tax=Neltuma alba TaxID=207710 RepID=UPI0010A2AAC7|nr:transmembrane protein 87B-like isoform X1 [Prosopis alba]XP_028808611.1 transmembrane protein 87B-like isoform X1 [Prosopis alba]
MLRSSMKKSKMIEFLLQCVISLCVLIPLVNASIHEYANEAFIHRSNAFFFHGGSEGLYASKIRDSSTPVPPDKPLKGKSFIRFDTVTFVRPKEYADKHNEMQQNTGLVEAIILEVKDRERIGGSFLKSDLICCTPALAKEGHCTTGEVIIQKNQEDSEFPKRIKTFFQGNNEEVQMETQSIQINSTGMYYLYFMICDPQLKGTIVKGRTVWRNPDGYLPGKMAPLMTFYGFMSLAYLLLGLIWFLRFVQFWKDIIQLHYHITAVIALGMCEMAIWYFEYANFNSTGTRPMGITLWAVTCSCVKKTLSRLLLLVVSMGFGVVRPTLGGITSKVLLLGLVYFVASEALELVENLGNINDFSGKTKLVLVLPVVFLDTCFILWIFSSLSKTLEKLQIRRNMAKLELYRKFTNTLAVSVLLSIAWVGFELYFNATDPLSELWRIAWIIPAFWALLAYALLVVICVLWAPSRNPTRYAYLEGTGDDFDEEGISLTSGVMKMSGDVAAKLDRKERKGSSATDLTYVEDIEEDKRE